VQTATRLISFAPEHFPILSSWFETEAELVQWGGPSVNHPLTIGQLQAMIDEGAAKPPRRLCWMAMAEGEMIGHAQLGLDWRNGNAVLSRVAVAPHARGRGVAAPFLRLVLAEAFALKTIERAELNVYTWNTPAIRTYQRLGFKAEGVRRSSTRVGAERWDTAMMGLLRTEWAILSAMDRGL
jgi:RimJ/RimL family protein N-acetyltransferase